MRLFEIKLEAIKQAVSLESSSIANSVEGTVKKDAAAIVADAKTIYDFLIEGIKTEDEATSAPAVPAAAPAATV